MGAAYFYHLSERPIEATLPMLIGKARHAGWRVCVRGGNARRIEWLDDRLWQGDADAFLPHGMAGGNFDADQPVLLTTGSAMPNGAQCLMTMDGADIAADEVAALERVCILFDGKDAGALDKARGQWRALTAAGCSAQYWSEDAGRWQKKAES